LVIETNSRTVLISIPFIGIVSFFNTSEVTIFSFVYKPLENYIKFTVSILLTVATQKTRHRKGNFLIV